MKKTILIIVLIFLFNLFSCTENKKSSLIGKWKVISIDTGDFYLNTKTDSIYISKEFKEIFSDSLQLNEIIEVTKMAYANNIIDFNEDGTYEDARTYTKKIGSEIRMYGTYKTKPLDRKVSVTFKDDINIEMDYKIIDSLLHLKMTLYDKKSELVLEKIEK